MARIAVIGAGVSGLSTAFGLMQQGADVTLFESSGRTGGVIHSLSRDGFLIETAANGFIDRELPTARMVDALGLRPKLRPAEHTAKVRYIYTRGEVRSVPASPPAFMASKILPWSAKLRLALELFTPRRNGGEESVASFARRHVGERAMRVLIDAVQTGIFAGDVEKLSVGAVFPKMIELEKNHRSLVLAMIAQAKQKRRALPDPEAQKLTGILTSFEGGMETLTRTMAGKLGERVRLDAPARRLEHTASGWRLTLDGGTFDADKVVVASPAHVTAELVRPFAADLASELEPIEYAAVASVHLGFHGLPHPPTGFGFLVPSEEQRRILGALFISSFFPWRAPNGATLLTLMMGGARRPDLVALSEDELVQHARAEIGSMLGIKAEPSFVHVVRWPRAIPQYNVGHLARVERVDALLDKHPGLFLTGNSLKGIGVNDCLRASEQLVPRVLGSHAK